jgi:prepilin peptidase CpaA
MSGPDFLQLACVAAYAVVLITAAWQDWQTLQIADGFPLAIIGLYGLWAASGLASDRTSPAEIGFAAVVAIALLVFGAIAFASGMLGGGDVKLLAAAGLFAGFSYLVVFLLVLALAGGALSLLALMGIGIGAPSGADDGRRYLPYGPAIAAAGLAVAVARVIA